MTKHAKNPLQRLLAMLLCVTMLAGFAVPAMAEEANIETGGAQMLEKVDDKNKVVLGKQAELADDGTYTIQLSAFSTAKESKMNFNLPIDFIFVLDASGSMASQKTMEDLRVEKLEAALEELVAEISKKSKADDTTKSTYADHKVAFITFANSSTASGAYYDRASVNGRFRTWANTGIFVNGTFKNYHSSSTDKDTYSYTRVYNPDPESGKTYYVMQKYNSEGSATANMTKVTYNKDSSKWQYKKYSSDGTYKTTTVTPQKSVDDQTFSHKQFYTRETITYTKLTADDYKGALININNSKGNLSSTVTKTIEQVAGFGSTMTHYGMIMAKNVLNNNAPRKYTDSYGIERTGQQVVILFTDGDSKSSQENNYKYADQIKDIRETKIYTIAVGDISSANKKELEHMSSNYANCNDTKKVADAKYYYTADNMSGLSAIFQGILADVVTDNTELNESTVLRDYMNTGFVLPEGFDAKNIILQVQDMTFNGTEYIGGDVTTLTAGEMVDNTIHYTNGDETLTLTIDRTNNMVSVTGFDYQEHSVSENYPGKRLLVTLKGIQMTPDVSMDVSVATNKANSGIGTVDENGSFTPATTFPQPVTKAVTETYVMDYAKPINIFPCAWFTEIKGIGTAPTLLDITADGITTVDTKYGTFVGKCVDKHEGAVHDHMHLDVKFTPKTMQWDEPASLFLFGKFDEAAVLADTEARVTTGNYMWGKINVIPANNIYYEDDFVTNTETGTAGIVYSGEYNENGYSDGWTVEGESNGNTEAVEGEEGDETGVHGWQDTLDDDAGYSDGSAHKADANVDSTATATFTFTGTGVDIYSRTNNTTGTVLATLKGVDVEASKGIIVDNVSESGDYYQIPTLSFSGLDYGTYTVTIRVTTAAKDRFVYYLDGIRVYNPIEEDDLVLDAYGEQEINAVFTEVRDLLAKSGDATSMVFIDKAEDGTTNVVTDYDATEYGTYGPKNEVYLAKGQSITFKAEAVDGQYVYIGLKSPTGEPVSATVSNGNATNKTIAVTHTTDLYYAVAPNNGFITVMNNGEGLLSVTKIRTTGVAGDLELPDIDEEEALDAVELFASYPVVDSEGNPVDPENPETPDVPEEPDVEIENPTEPEQPEEEETPEDNKIGGFLGDLFGGFSGWFR